MKEVKLTDAEVETIKNIFAHFKNKPVDDIQKDVATFEAVLRRARCGGCSRKGNLQHHKINGREFFKCGFCGYENF